MNRRVFLTALGAVATHQKWRRLSLHNRLEIDPDIEESTITTSRFPYVQNLRSDRASILWATFESGVGTVQYSSDGMNFHTVVARSRFFSRLDTGMSASFVQHQADLVGLSP